MDADEHLRVLICGSRTWQDGGPIQAIVRQYAMLGPCIIIHGAAKGADSQADKHARSAGLEVEDYPAKWQEHHPDWCPGAWCQARSYCVAAGPRRNQQMIDVGRPDVVWAFLDKPRAESKGTADMLDRASTHGVPWYSVESSQ